MSILRTVTVIGGNLWDLAAREMGDATQAHRIARVNGITDPVLVGRHTLNIPAPDSTQSGGVPDA